MVNRCRLVWWIVAAAGCLLSCRESEDAGQRCNAIGAPVGVFAAEQMDTVQDAALEGDSAVVWIEGKQEADFRTAFAMRLTRKIVSRGEGPDEVRSPERLLTRPGGELYLVDGATEELLELGTTGRIIRRVQPYGGRSSTVESMPRWRAMDSSGLVYGYSPTSRRSTDTVVVVRCSVSGASCDTAARVPRELLDLRRAPGGEVSGIVLQAGAPRAEGLLAFGHDGEVFAISERTLEIVQANRPSAPTRTGQLARTDERISDSDWDAMVAADSLRMVNMVNQGLDQALAAGAHLEDIPTRLRTVVRSPKRPVQYPQLGQGDALVTDDQALWIPRGHGNNPPTRVDVLAATGAVRCWLLPAGTRLLSIRGSLLLGARVDSNGLDRLVTFRRPP